MADSRCCTTETNTTLESNHPPIKINKNKTDKSNELAVHIKLNISGS